MNSPLPFLRIPPFPGARPRVGVAPALGPVTSDQAGTLALEIVRLRVGGAFWKAQPVLPPGRDVVLAPNTRQAASRMIADVEQAGQIARAMAVAPSAWFAGTPIPCVDPSVDPWHLVTQADTIWAGGDDDLALIAALDDRAVRVFGAGRFAALADVPDRETALRCLADVLASAPMTDPFTGTPWDLAAAITQLGDWRALIDENRVPKAIYGIARWKRITMDALLWAGAGAVRYGGSPQLAAGDTVLAWSSRVSNRVISDLTAKGVRIGEIEDGMIRSQGLGANCVPPLSVIVDHLGVHFDSSQSSALETILSESHFAPEMLARAAALRARLIAVGLSKYGATPPIAASTPADKARRRILVPGQVEDDRSVLTGGGGMTNLELLARARAREPDAHITYRPHPDVEAGHRKGHVAEVDALALADTIERNGAITDAIEAADALHVITSLAGFEALMRGKQVVTHGVPFYAGWGLTKDHGVVPARRGRPRTIDELVAAVLILYPRYLDPVTRLPCPVEILVERLAAGDADISSPLVVLRTWQGKVSRLADRFGARAR